MEKVALVTGSSSGIGYETSLALARAGYLVHATMRDTSKGAGLLEAANKEGLKISVSRLDVDEPGGAAETVSRIVKESGRLDVLVNNAGYGIFGSVEDVTIDEFRAQFETNFFGVIRMIQAAAPVMRGQKGGCIVNISSVAGKIGFPGTPAYISSKFALEGLSESLRYELGPHGVSVVIIEPGVIKTNFFDAMKVAAPREGSPYAESTAKVIEGVKMMAQLGTHPRDVAATVAKCVDENVPLPRYIVGNDAAMFLDARRSRTDLEFEEYLKKEIFPS
ncbi:short-chain alcohol dehydrogenase [Cenarchaeum symbiosum A]|uniref:Short-chain alcohol dehydrogenase n=1 Tax=Cenarchaeum symbiosum (strain A) TaxID=414004 RepID=A0RXB6_CENSY|nr:short-chain alcohol dehydrogenase [Cenarchaeum symbiosum A]